MANNLNNSISFYRRISGIKSSETIPLDIFLENIRNGKYEDIVNKVRLIKNKKERDAEKEKAPSVTISGTFAERTDNGIIKHSGFLGVDVDPDGLPKGMNCEQFKDMVSKDPYVQAAFTSISGLGTCLLFKVNAEKHREAFQGIAEYMFKTYQCFIDPTSINVSRPRFVSFDPNIHISDRAALKFTQYPKSKPPKKVEKVIYAEKDFHNVMEQLVSRRLNIVENYHDWLRVGFAFSHKFGEQGRQYFHLVSQFSTKYDADDCDRQYTACLKHKSSKETTIATFYYYAKAAGLDIYTEETKKIAYSASQGKKSGLKPEQVAENLQKFEDIQTDEAVLDIIKQVFDNNIDINEDTMLDQIELWIRQNYSLQRNEITRYIENDGKPLQKKDLNTIYIKAKKLFERCTYELIDKLIDSDFVPTYNPFQRFFSENAPGMQVELGSADLALPVNNIAPDAFLGGIPNLKTGPHLPAQEFVALLKQYAPNVTALFQTITTKDPDYALYFGTKWLVGVISSMFGQHSPLYMAFMGPQGTGKTEFYRRLLPEPLKPYYGESKLDRGKDDEMLMCQKVIIVDDEMSGKTRKETKRFNDLTSKDWFSLREPYGRGNVDLKRLASLAGNTNHDDEVLHDVTGNRRVIQIFVFSINHAAYNAIDKVALWVELYNLYRAGMRWELTKEDRIYLNQDAAQYEVVSLEGELVSKYFKTGQEEWTATDIKVHIEKETQQRISIDRVGKELKRLGFTQEIVKRDGKTKRIWFVEPLTRPKNWQPPARDEDDVPF